jgi:hypothetical protein
MNWGPEDPLLNEISEYSNYGLLNSKDERPLQGAGLL